MSRKLENCVLNVPVFAQYIAPKGELVPAPACHALFYYYTCAIQTYKEQIETIKLEQDRSAYNYFELYKSVALLYDVSPDAMQRYWPLVDRQARALGLTLLPKEARYRSPERGNSLIITHGTR